MATNYEAVHLPRGYEVAIQTDVGTPGVYTDLGVTYEDASMEFTYDTTKWTGSQGEAIKTFLNNMAVSTTFNLAQIKLDNINKLMSGASAYSTVAGTPVAVTGETTAGGSWTAPQFIAFQNQSASGAVPTSISVVNDGTLTISTDYDVVKLGDTWGVYVKDTVNTDDAEDVVLAYTYTPAASKKISVGSSSVDIAPRALRLRKNMGTTAAPKWFTVLVYSAVNEGGLSMAFPRWDATEPTTLAITMTGQLDTSRTDLDQLFSITDEFGV
jgi:hypothetical protein